VLCVYVFLLGAGLGLAMQPLVLAVQNDFPRSAVGTATSANNFFREIGATLGSAAVGAVFTHRLADQLENRLTADAARTVGNTDALTPALVHSLPEKVQDTVILSYQHALTPVFRYLLPVFALGLVLALLLPEKKLADDHRPAPDTDTDTDTDTEPGTDSVAAAGEPGENGEPGESGPEDAKATALTGN
jgi:hypothetical protein